MIALIESRLLLLALFHLRLVSKRLILDFRNLAVFTESFATNCLIDKLTYQMRKIMTEVIGLNSTQD